MSLGCLSGDQKSHRKFFSVTTKSLGPLCDWVGALDYNLVSFNYKKRLLNNYSLFQKILLVISFISFSCPKFGVLVSTELDETTVRINARPKIARIILKNERVQTVNRTDLYPGKTRFFAVFQ